MKRKFKTAEEKKAEVTRLTENMDKAIDDYFHSPEDLKEYLRFMSQFRNYSLRNTALIQNQFPGATAVGSFKFWKEKGYSVNKGEKGIKILVPHKVSGRFQTPDGEWKLLKEATEKEKEMIKNKELKSYSDFIKFGVGHVFDISQTNAPVKDIPKIFPNKKLEGKVENFEEFQRGLEKIADNIGVEIIPNDRELGAAKGVFYPFENAIELNKRNSQFENVTTLLHELAHAKLHTKDKTFETTDPEKEFQAEMVSYAVSTYFGFGKEKEEESLRYLSNWTKGKSLADKERLLEEVRSASVEFIETIENEWDKEKIKTAEIVYLVDHGKGSIQKVTLNDLKEGMHETDEQFIQRFNQERESKFFILKEDEVTEPMVLINWSEHPDLKSQQLIKFNEADLLFGRLNKEALSDLGYYKTRYHIIFKDDFSSYTKNPKENHSLSEKEEMCIVTPDRHDIGDGLFNGIWDQLENEPARKLFPYLTSSQKEMFRNYMARDNVKEKEACIAIDR
ncbi:LPD25 domain-containing protein [Bacillus licheniformis]|uniref:LPD25 domain-containing protein n=1 Tax=Bacillus TaxID=1386 RepID=UPI0013827E40|nr:MULTISPECIES: LPD25 domain-containing protein [Bacillus]MCD2526292.1 ssDNA-binding domain-containing protein [Bacillus licheniformis]MDE1397178.1 ArdC-like ssDNA-binding domain-containing protein [Bacillus licheniformis]TWN77127.1 hypothetical protein CHCC20494_1190 [Bacillus licheniformis]WHF43734.1 ArdC-like ssDNA-binding domain-containing protein [Bacillus licheniformis]